MNNESDDILKKGDRITIASINQICLTEAEQIKRLKISLESAISACLELHAFTDIQEMKIKTLENEISELRKIQANGNPSR